MCGPYWSQFSHGELMSMQGVEIDDPDYDNDDEDFDDDETREDDEEEGCSCGNVCMDCLGMSWRDFM